MTVITALWGRPTVTQAFLEHWDAIEGVDLIAAVDPVEDLKPVGRWRFVEAPNPRSLSLWVPGNTSISDRFQAAADLADDDIMVMGSDDFADQEYVNRCLELVEEWQLIQPTDIYMMSRYESWYCDFWTTGAGRVIRKDLIKRAGGKLWSEPVNRGLDNACYGHLNPHLESGYIYKHRQEGTILVDFKTDENMWGFEHTISLLPLAMKLKFNQHQALLRWLPELLSTLPPSQVESGMSAASSAI